MGRENSMSASRETGPEPGSVNGNGGGQVPQIQPQLIEAIEASKACLGCAGIMVPLTVGTRLSVHLPGDTPEAYWTATPLDAYTCTDCGRTELFARNPQIFSR